MNIHTYRVGLDHFLPNLQTLIGTNDKRWKNIKKRIRFKSKPWRETTNKKIYIIVMSKFIRRIFNRVRYVAMD